MHPRPNRALLFCSALVVSLSAACGQSQSPAPAQTAPPAPAQTASPAPPAAADSAAHKSFAFRGMVHAVDPAAKTLTVENENIEGWMSPMTMSYHADSDAVYSTVKAGDRITATVYEGDMTLHDVKVVPAEGQPPAGK